MLATSTSPLVLGRYDEAALLAMFDEEGVLAAIGRRGFAELALEIDASRLPLTHVRLSGAKDSGRFLLLDACLTEARLEAEATTMHPGPVELLVVYWLREQDPTSVFDMPELRLPLQDHPGLGVLRRAFRVALRIARELGKHGIAAMPKYFHDAAIFYRSKLFLFLDAAEQGRFEALLRDLAPLSLCDASLAVSGSAVRDREGALLRWQPGYQVMPLAPALVERFHEPSYQTSCREAFERSSFVVDQAALEAARRVYQQSIGGKPGC